MEHPTVSKKTYSRVLKRSDDQRTTITVRSQSVGGTRLAVFAGPCSVETPDQTWKTARHVKDCGAHFFRAGAHKPSTYPSGFRGHGREALELLADIGRELSLPIVTEVMDTRDVAEVARFADVLQIGARNAQNYQLLTEVGAAGKPVFLKRGMWMTIDELLGAAEYVMEGGTEDVILCERGILVPTLNTFSNERRTRWRLDLQIVPELKRLSHLPVVVDPSHGTGDRDSVPALARAAVAVGADGLMIEVHPEPERSVTDPDQAISFETFASLMRESEAIAAVMGRSVTS